jgi:hypothetical protein
MRRRVRRKGGRGGNGSRLGAIGPGPRMSRLTSGHGQGRFGPPRQLRPDSPLTREKRPKKERKRVANPGLFDPQMTNRQLFGLKMQASVASFSTSTHLTVLLSVASI